MAAEAGHHAGRVYIDQDGDFHLNGASFFNDAESDISGSLETIEDLSPAELGFLDGAIAGTVVASVVLVADANKDVAGINDLTFGDGGNIVVNATTGTKIGTAVTQKLGFWNVTPVVQPASANQAAVAAPTAYSAHASGAVAVTSNAATDLDTTAAALATLVTEVTNLRTLVDAMRTALVDVGIMKGAA